MKIAKHLLSAAMLLPVFAAVLALNSAPLLAQAPAAGGATVHGKLTNPAGFPFTGGGKLEFTKDKNADLKDAKILYTFTLNPDGTYSGTGVAPGDYFVYVLQDTKTVDRLPLLVAPTDTDKTLDFDMSRAEYIKTLTPEQLKALEDYKKGATAAVKDNAVIANLNNTLNTVRADLKAAATTKADVTTDVTNMKAAVDAKPDVGLLWLTYGDTLMAQAEHLVAEDHKTHTSIAADEPLKQHYVDAVDAYKKAIDLEAASKKPVPANQAAAYNQLGNALAKISKPEEASAAFESAVKIEPAKAGMYYNNAAAVLYNSQQTDAAAAAADKAIAADPTRPDPYFIKGQALVAKSSFDAKTNKLTPPPGCVEAYQKYLELAPTGQYSTQVKEMLAQLGEKIDKNYRAPKR